MRRRFWDALAPNNTGTKVLTQIDGAPPIWSAFAGDSLSSPPTVGDIAPGIIHGTLIDATIGLQAIPYARTATALGDGTAVIPANTSHVTITSSVNTKLITLPVPVAGVIVRMFEPTNGYRLQSDTPADVYINGVKAGGNYLQIPAGAFIEAHAVDTTHWIVKQIGSLGQLMLNFDGIIGANTPALGSFTRLAVAASALTLDPAAVEIDLTGKTQYLKLTGDAGGNVVATITNGTSGQLLVIEFIDALVTLTHAAGANNPYLLNKQDYLSNAGDILVFQHNGTVYNEIARKLANGQTSVAATATADGLTTGLILSGADYVTITSSVNTKLVSLPVPAALKKPIKLVCDTNGYRLQTDTPANVYINGVKGGGTYIQVPAGALLVCTPLDATHWLVNEIGSLGQILNGVDAIVGGNNPLAVTGTVITANTNFVGQKPVTAQIGVTATVLGDGAGIIPDTAENVLVTSDNNAKIVSLPTPTPGAKVRIYCAATGYKLISNDPTNVAINDVAGALKQLTVAATDLLIAECVSATEWFIMKIDKLGAPATAGVAA